MSPHGNQFRAAAAALAASFLLAPAFLAAQASSGQAAGEKVAPPKKAVAPRKPPARRTAPAAKHSPSVSKRKQPARSASKGKRRLSPRQQRARLHLQPDRTQEIQRALIQAGYLHEEATGSWDEATREAMRRYQTDHGYPATGLPEAKSLMKLGLGPHPLPAEVDPSVKAQADAVPEAKVDPPADPSSHHTEASSPPQ